MTPEGAIVRACMDYLRISGVVCWRNNTGAARYRENGASGPERLVKYGHPGSGDIFGLLPRSGRFLSIECKTPKGQATRLQLEFIDLVNKSGGVAFIARSVDDVIHMLGKELS